MDGNIPAGWSYNPSAWPQRLPIVLLAAGGFIIAAYLALFQYGHITDVWDPFFKDGTRRILNSSTSFLLPVSDATLGAIAYIADAVSGIIGGERRWQTMPWVVLIFAVFVGPLSAVSLWLVIAQPVFYDTWCTLCLVSAVISIIMVGPAMDEALASLQYIKQASPRTPSIWPTFWGVRPIRIAQAKAQPAGQKGSVWPLWISMGLGVWVMVSPAVFEFSQHVADLHHILGPLIFALATIALWETTRSLKYLNVPLGGFLILIGWASSHLESAEPINAGMTGLLLIASSLVPIGIQNRYGGGWRRLFK